MTEADAKTRMEHHGITTAQQAVYYYQGFRYASLMDALTYADLVESRANAVTRKRRQNERTYLG